MNGLLFVGVFALVTILLAALNWRRRRKARQRAMIHRIMFAPKIEIRCNNGPAEAGSTRTPDSLCSSNVTGP